MASIFSGVDLTQRALDYHLQRHSVLAGNVANVDTPGFRPQELVRSPEGAPGAQLRLATTDGSHLGPQGGSRVDGLELREERVVQAGGDGNAVSLEREMAKVGANQVRFEAAGRIVRQQLGMLRYAAGDATSG